MKNVRQLSRQNSNSASSDEDGTDKPDAKYKNFKNKSEQGSQKSTESETDNNTIGDFINPVFRPANNEDAYDNPKTTYDTPKTTYDTPKTGYDSLSFTKDKESPTIRRAPTPKTKPQNLTKKHLAGDYTGAAEEFARWNKAGGRVMKGLVRRRAAEARLYRS